MGPFEEISAGFAGKEIGIYEIRRCNLSWEWVGIDCDRDNLHNW